MFLLDKILSYYHKQQYVNSKDDIVLELSKETFDYIQKEDPRTLSWGQPDSNGELRPIVLRRVFVIPTNEFKWRWVNRSISY